MKKNCGWLLAIVLVGFHISLPQVNSPLSTFELNNGIRVILAPNNNLEATCVTSYHLAGIRNDPVEIRGASSFYETLMLSGTENLDEMDRFLLIKRLGGDFTNKINYDFSYFNLLISSTEVDNALWLESERIDSLNLKDTHINRLKNIIYNRYYRMITSDIRYQAKNWVREKLFENTIYKTPPYGNIEDIRGFSNRKIIQLYDNFRSLSNLILVISGKIDVEVIKDLIGKRFNKLVDRRRLPKRNYLSVPPRSNYIYNTWTNEKLKQPFFVLGIRAPAKISYDFTYFNFIKYYLLDSRISKLKRSLSMRGTLRVDFTYDFTDYFECNALLITVSADNRIELEKARVILNRELAAFTSVKDISSTDLRSTKSLMEIDFKKALRKLETRNQMIAENYILFKDLNFAQKTISRIRNINSLDIIRIGKKFLIKDNMVVLNVVTK